MVAEKQIETFLSHLSIEKGASKNTIAAYRRDIKSFEDFLTRQEKNLEVAVQRDIQDFLSSLRKTGIKESSLARKLVAIRAFFGFCSKEFGSQNIADEIEVPKVGKRLPKALSVEEVQRLIDSNPQEGVGLRDRAMIELLYSSGARVSELIALNVSDVATNAEGFATVQVRGKGGKDRIVPIGSFARKALDDYLVRQRPTLALKKPSPALFLNQNVGRLSRQSAWAIVVGAAQRAGLSEKVSPHALRHSFATHLIDGGADIRVVQELLGHSSVTTTQIYTLVTIDKLRESFAAAHPRAR